MSSRLARLAALFALAASAPGCTLVGYGVGALVDSSHPARFRERPPSEVRAIGKDELVHVRARNGWLVEGKLVGVVGPSALGPESYLVVELEHGGVSHVPLSDVRSIGVEVPKRGWVYGTLIGAAVDVTALVVIVIAAATYDPFGGGDLNMGCFC